MKILITADDGDAVNPRKGTAIIHLHVKDDNNHAPVINFNCLQPCPNNTGQFENISLFFCNNPFPLGVTVCFLCLQVL